jgi:D-alanyl-D-alanine carboxypeptidase
MKKQFLLLTACLLFIFNARADISGVYTYKMQHLLDSLCQKYHVKGISAAIYRPGDGLWTGAYGESEAGVPITTDMYLPIGSNTKTFTSAIILKLQENGLLSINDTIGTWIQNQPNISGQITIKQLLNHTSGLYDYTHNAAFFTALNADYNKVWQPEDMFQFIDVPVAAPGAPWSYCNTNYLLLGMIIKQVTGQPLHKAYRDMVCTPQQLSHTVFFPDEQPNGTVPHGWSADLGTQLEDMQVDYGWSNTAFLSMASSAGAILSTAEDNVMFWHKLMDGQIINGNSLAQMKDFIVLDPNTSYGLGLFREKQVNGHTVYAHGGTCFGYLDENLVDSVNGVCITILSNQDSLGNSFLFNKILMPLHKLTTQMPPAGIIETTATHINIYPNPANNILSINAGTTNGLVLELYDMTGTIVVKTTLHNGVTNISLAAVNNGLYITRIAQDGLPLQAGKLQIVH